MQICKEVIAIMMKNMVLSHSLIPHVEKRMSSIFKKQFLTMEREFQEEYERKVVALTAECNLETRKKMEAQRQKERAANEEAEELIKKVNEMVSLVQNGDTLGDIVLCRWFLFCSSMAELFS